MDLECQRFEFCPEVTAKGCRMDLDIVEVPIRYRSRSVRDGKKIGLRDAWEAVRTLWQWLVLLYREDCARCQEELPRYAALAAQLRETSSSRQVAAIEVPPYGDGSLVQSLGPHAIVYGRLSDQRDWFVETPAVLSIANHGIVERKE